MPFVVAFFIAFLLKPLINWLAKKIPINRKIIAVLVLVLVYAVAITLLILLGAKIGVWLSELFSGLPAFYRNTVEPVISNIGKGLDGFITGLDPDIKAYFETISTSLSNSVSSAVTTISSSAINYLGGMATRIPAFLVALFLTIIASFFFVMDYYKITSFLARQLSDNAKRRLFVVKDYVVNVLFRFVRAYLILMSITFAEMAIGLLILRVPNAVAIAFGTALVDVLPVFGTGAVMIPWIVFTFISGDFALGMGLLILYTIITVVRQVVEPRVVGGQIGLYPLLTLVCMFIGAQLFGFWGMLGLPVAVTVLVHLNRSGEIALFREPAEDPPLKGRAARQQRRQERRAEKNAGTVPGAKDETVGVGPDDMAKPVRPDSTPAKMPTAPNGTDAAVPDAENEENVDADGQA